MSTFEWYTIKTVLKILGEDLMTSLIGDICLLYSHLSPDMFYVKAGHGDVGKWCCCKCEAQTWGICLRGLWG